MLVMDLEMKSLNKILKKQRFRKGNENHVNLSFIQVNHVFANEVEGIFFLQLLCQINVYQWYLALYRLTVKHEGYCSVKRL